MNGTKPTKPIAVHGKIWIDLDNSPHVPLFKPVYEELIWRGYEVVLTARHCFQVPQLVEKFNLKSTFIGRHYPFIESQELELFCEWLDWDAEAIREAAAEGVEPRNAWYA